MSANDPHDYVRAEIDWLKVPLKENRPYLGICLGAQMLARHLGAQVAADEKGLTEIGWYRLRPTEHGRQMMRWPQMVYHFHREGFDLPHGAKLLAEGDAYPNQAFRFGDNAFGIQFHAELTRAMMQSCGARREPLHHAQRPARQRTLEGRMLFDAPLRAWLSDFLEIVFERQYQTTGD